MKQEPTLDISEEKIRQLASVHLENSNLLTIALRQAFFEQWMRISRRLTFRFGTNDRAREAYRAMNGRDLERVNARQQWANWRTIPRNLSGRAPARPVEALDLCCGIGHSTEVLFAHLVSGSHILGLEYNPAFVDYARERASRYAAGATTKVEFRAQSVLETFCDAENKPLEKNSIDIINCSGAVGNHFDVMATKVLVQEITRVLKTGGLALIDSGPDGTTTEELIGLFKSAGYAILNSTKSCFADRYTQVCAQKRS